MSNQERPWNEGGEAKPYSVTLWDTHPDKGEDTCCTGEDYATEAEARQAFDNPEAHFPGMEKGYWRHTPYVMLDGPDAHEVRQRPGIKPLRSDDGEWKREQAMQTGMAFGCEGYNEVMGYD